MIHRRGAEIAEVLKGCCRSACEMEGPKTNLNELTQQIIGACIEVHRELGPGLLESAYKECLCHELSHQGLHFTRQQPLPVIYKGIRLDCGYQLDIVVEGAIILELKSVERLLPIHDAQLLTHLKLAHLSRIASQLQRPHIEARNTPHREQLYRLKPQNHSRASFS